ASSLGRSQGSLRQPGYRPTGGDALARHRTLRTRGEPGAGTFCPDLDMSRSPWVLRAPAAAVLMAMAAWPLVSSSQTQRLEPVVVTGTRETMPPASLLADRARIAAHAIRA